MTAPRFAIYFIPARDSSVYQFGASVVGYDCYTRLESAFPPDPPLTDGGWMRVTEAPRLYGFHATIKAPFFLAKDATEAALADALRAHARTASATSAIPLSLEPLGDFIALVPRAPSPVLNKLAGEIVRTFDRFRAPLTQQERQRRLQAGLNLRQASHLERWGYPYVFEDFRFHMTLTGPLAEADRAVVLRYLQSVFDNTDVDDTIRVDRLCLVRQDWPGARFQVVGEMAFGRG